MSEGLEMKPLVYLLSLMLVVPLASASEATGLTAQNVEAHNGSIEGQLVMLKLLARGEHMPKTSFELDSSSVRVEVDQAELVVGTVQRTYVNPTTEASNYKDSLVSGIDNGAETRWALDPWPGHEPPRVELATACSMIGPAMLPTESTPAMVRRDVRPDRVADLTETMRPIQCDEAPLAVATIQGDFRLSLWDWSFSVTDASGTQVIETGARPRSDGVGNEASEAFLFATNATLTILLDRPSAFYVKDANVTGDELMLRGAHGPLRSDGTTRILDGEDVVLYDVLDTRLTAQGVDEPLQIELPPRVQLSPTTQAPETPLRTPYTLTVLAGLIAAVAAGLAVRQRPLWYESRNRRLGRDPGSYKTGTRAERRGLGYWIMAKAAHRARRFPASLRYAQRAHALFPAQPEVRLMLATALENNGQPAKALVHYIAASGMLDERRRKGAKAQALLGASVTNARMGHIDAAVDHFSKLADLHPELATQRLGHPSLLILDDNPRFQAIRRHLEAKRKLVPEDPGTHGVTDVA